jgi:pimeloyl-ACP methyl ester carboxylesterase
MRRRRTVAPPDPPAEMLPARTVRVPGRGEFFLRDSGGDGPAVMLLHGWMVSADLNWWAAYGDLVAAGYRVLAIDHRGHGRGLRAMEPFRIRDVAADAAAVLRQLGVAPALVAGYSMGGAIAQQLAHNHPEVVRGVVLSGTAQHWQDPQTQRAFKALGMLGLMLSLAPRFTYGLAFRRVGVLREAPGAWVRAELMRGEARDIAEAGRELGRFDSRPWLGRVRAPFAVVLTTRDELVSPDKQRALAEAARARVFEVPLTHLELSWRGEAYNPALLAALAAVSGAGSTVAPAAPAAAPVDRVA